MLFGGLGADVIWATEREPMPAQGEAALVG
jgi:hypothetical protein